MYLISFYIYIYIYSAYIIFSECYERLQPVLLTWHDITHLITRTFYPGRSRKHGHAVLWPDLPVPCAAPQALQCAASVRRLAESGPKMLQGERRKVSRLLWHRLCLREVCGEREQSTAADGSNDTMTRDFSCHVTCNLSSPSAEHRRLIPAGGRRVFLSGQRFTMTCTGQTQQLQLLTCLRGQSKPMVPFYFVFQQRELNYLRGDTKYIWYVLTGRCLLKYICMKEALNVWNTGVF